ncbi:hypothetical protein GALMADRAFT_246871 [Galerina marginata CBS 339.88]|uniref:NAD(P)-binding protein n=1 Tax=Galerina marginata (strain CBS 339.88) TaxID=685588 RepID=A0A067SZZ2_GALM3|nr:hypothetical protein GALMADRAFT_246871 [Galerina marginata CBS 339.88]
MLFWSKKFDPTKDLADLTGKVIIVTGANTGIGYSTVKHLARRGAKVYLGSRSEEKGTLAISKLQEEGIGSGEVVPLSCDLSTPALAKKAAEDFLQRETRLDVLVNNAGLLHDHTDKPAQDGITEMMMVNHIGTFQFTTTLLPLLLKTSEEPNSDVRILTVTSDGHTRGVAAKPDINFSTMDEFKNTYAQENIPYFARYFISKLGNVLFTNALQRRIASSSIICMSLHPGVSNTSFSRNTPFPRLVFFLMSLFVMTPDEGAHTSCFAAASPLVRQEADKYKGAYLEPIKISQASENARKIELQDQLWETTEKYLQSLDLSM